MVNGRPRKTQEELDREMEEYWSKREGANGTAGANGEVGGVEGGEAVVTAVEPVTEDIEMIE